jgi:hypothetical protein
VSVACYTNRHFTSKQNQVDLLRYYLDNGELKTTTDIEVVAYLADQNKRKELADFIYQRHYHRYIKPFEYISDKKVIIKATGKQKEEYSLLYKNGFSIMANCCLLIETFEAFYRGWDNTRNQSENAFLKFFTRDKNFTEFAIDDLPTQFYKNIRCGILHQGETTQGWTLTRDGKVIIDKVNKRINATIFLTRLHKSLSDYKQELENADWNDTVWDNARKKLKAIIKNTKK